MKKTDAQMLRDTDFSIEGILREDGVELDEEVLLIKEIPFHLKQTIPI